MLNKLENKQMDYLGMEYNSLRGEITNRTNLVTKLEIFSISASGIIWGWGFSQLVIPSMWIAVGSALLILSGAFFVAYEIEGIFRIGTYIAAKYEDNQDFGFSWETSNIHFTELTKAHNIFSDIRLTRHSFYYLILIVINLLVSTISTITLGSIKLDLILISGILFLIIITICIYFPIKRIERATRSLHDQVAKWKEVLNNSI